MTIEQIEKKIRGGMNAIKNKTKTPQEAGLGTFFSKLKVMDEAMYIKLINEYKEVLLKNR